MFPQTRFILTPFLELVIIMLSSFVSSAMVMFSLDIDILESSILSLSIPKKEREFIAFNLIFFLIE